MNEKLMQEILMRIENIEMTIKDMQGFNREPIAQTMLRSYHEGIEEGKRQAMEAMKETAHSHKPSKNIYGWHGFEEDGDD